MKNSIMRAARRLMIAAIMIAFLVTGLISASLPVRASIPAMPLISLNAPAYASDNTAQAGLANNTNYDDNYRSLRTPSVGSPVWLAYDLSAKHPTTVDIVWYNDGTYGYNWDLTGGQGYSVPTDYTIDVNAAAGGAVPATGWTTVATVSGSHYHSREHAVDMTGKNWIRINVTGSSNAPQNSDVGVNMDVYDTSLGIQDTWLFTGDSITAGGMKHTLTTFAQGVNASDPHFPLEENAGIGGWTAALVLGQIDGWLAIYPGHFVTIDLGTNDVNSSPGDNTAINACIANLTSIANKVIAAGKVPIIPHIPWANLAAIQSNGPVLNTKIDQLIASNPQIIAGPDLYTFFQNNPGLISADNLHPSDPAGWQAYRNQWSSWALTNIYGAGGGTIPAVPTGLTATSGDAQVSLSWNASTGASVYNVKQSTVNGSGYAIVGTPATTSYTNTGLTNGTTYYYVVSAGNTAGQSANSSQAACTPLLPTSGAPTGVTAVSGAASALISWNVSNGATSYNVKRSTVNGSGYATIASSTTISYVNTGLTNGTTYYYVVSSVNTAGESANSTQVSATPSASLPPAGYNLLKTNYVLQSTDPGGWAGSGTSTLETEAGPSLPFDTTVTNAANGLPSLRVNTTALPAGGWWTAQITASLWRTVDISQYWANGNLEFWVKGNAGGEVFNIGLADRAYERSIGGTPTQSYALTYPITNFTTVSTGWQHVVIPLKTLVPSGSPFMLGRLWEVQLSQANLNAMKFWLNEIKFTSPDKEKQYPNIKVNQVGYTPNANKFALVTGWLENMTSIPNGTAFQVKKTSDNSVAYSGTLAWLTDYEPNVGGEKMLKADFTSFATAGTYYVSVAGLPNSVPFTIGTTVYDQLLVDSSRYYYYQRANLALAAPYAGSYPHVAWHMDDFTCPLQSAMTGAKSDVHAGWYDAGDFGKYTTAASTAVSDLMWTYETYPSKFTDSQNNIPESGNGKPDLLDEVKYELDFLLRMQDSVTGGFYSYIFPNNDITSARYIGDIAGGLNNQKPTSETGAAVGALAHASVVFASYDPVYATTCLNAAKAGWTYLVNNPTLVTDAGNYADNLDGNDRLFAAAELCRATNNNATYNSYFVANYPSFANALDSTTDNAHTVGNMEIPAFLAYMKSSAPDSGFVTWFTTKFNNWRTNQTNRTSAPWGTTLQDNDFFWGSNMGVLETNMDMVIGSKILGNFDSSVVKVAQQNFAYVLGVNPLAMSYVSGYGANAHQYVFSNIYSNDGVAGIPAGYMPGGANAYDGAWFSKFAAKCYTDADTDWVTNEHAIYWESGLVFNAAFASASEAGTNVPAPPAGLTATAGNTQITLNWTASSGATSYNVKRSTTSGGPYTTIASPATTSYTNTGLTNGTTYYFVVSALNAAGEGINSAQASAVPQGAIPSAPTGLTATPGNTQAALSWSVSAGATSYNVLRSITSGSGYASVATGIAVTTYTNTGLTNGTTYYFVVSASNATGTSGNSAQASATPQAPTADTAQYNFEAGIQGWTATGGLTSGVAVSTAQAFLGSQSLAVNFNGTVSGAATVSVANPSIPDGATITYHVWIPAGSAIGDIKPYIAGVSWSGDFVAIGGVTLNAWNTYTLTVPAGMAPDTSVGIQFDLTGAWTGTCYIDSISWPAGSAPAAPTGLTATAGNAQVALNWTASTGATSYNVKRSTVNGSGYATVSSPTVTSYTNTGLTNGTTYYYVVTAVNTSGESANSAQASATPVAIPAAPTGLTATPGNAQVALAWTVSTGATAYDVKRSTVNGSGYAAVASPTVTNYTNTSLTNGTTYYFVVDAKNASGTSANSAQVSAAPSAIPPVPAGLTATPGNAQVALSWTASTGATAYDVKRSTVNGSGYATVASPTVTNYTNTGLTNGTNYYFVVDAKNASGTSANSAQVSAKPVAPPAAPTGLTATPGNTQVTLAWTATAGATTYNVLRSTVNGSGYASAATGIAVTNYTNTGLTNGTTYYFVVSATNAGGTSANSAQASATPQPLAPAAPTGLTATTGNTQITLSWTASSGATSYSVYRGTTAGGENATAIASGIATTTYVNTGLTNGIVYYYKVKAANGGGVSAYSNEASATPIAPDPAQYNFEAGVQGWGTTGGMVTGVSSSTTQIFAGAHSLAVAINCTLAAGDTQSAQIAAPTTPAGAVVTFHVWIPSGSTISGFQVFGQEGLSGGWAWHGNWVPIASLTTNAWNTVQVTIPTTSTVPLNALGVQFTTTGVWAGTCYIDSVSW